MVYSDLKPDNLVLVRYTDKDTEKTIYKPCYKLKFIDLGSFTFQENQDEFELLKNKVYPAVHTEIYSKTEFYGKNI